MKGVEKIIVNVDTSKLTEKLKEANLLAEKLEKTLTEIKNIKLEPYEEK